MCTTPEKKGKALTCFFSNLSLGCNFVQARDANVEEKLMMANAWEMEYLIPNSSNFPWRFFFF